MDNRECVKQIMGQINSVLIGKEDKVEYVMTTFLAGGHLLLEDVPGVGKTTLANALARAVDVSFGRIQFTPDTLPSDVTGLSVYNMKSGEFEFSKGAIMRNIVLADEINRTSPKTQASLLEAMEEKQVTVDGTIYSLELPFMVIATQNPIDFLGTYNLPEAQLDRFMMKLSLGYPSGSQERRMAELFLNGDKEKAIKPVAGAAQVRRIQEEVTTVKVHEDLVGYIVDIVKATREEKSFTLGASPRATLALIRASQAVAYLDGRSYVIPDDIKKILMPVLCHRLVLSMEAKMGRASGAEILERLLNSVRVPILRE